MNRRLFATLLLLVLAGVIAWHLWLDRDHVAPPAATTSVSAPRAVVTAPALAPPAFVSTRFETRQDPAPAFAPAASAGWSATVVTDPATARSTEPLSALQSERLVSLLVLSATSSGRIDFAAVDLERATAAAGDFLTARQVIALRPLLAGRIARACEKAAPLASP